jgi:hypothetical protein
MPDWIALGRRKNDFGLMIDFHGGRAIVRANAQYIDEPRLEEIPAGRNGFAPCMVLVCSDWKRLYLVIEREGWDDDDYFEFAEKRLRELKVVFP